MNTKRISKLMSLILRHNPGVINASLDENGWLDVDDLILGIKSKGLEITREILEKVVETNNKKRFSFSLDGTKIRANQGHSIDVDIELKPTSPPEFLYHGTVEKYLDAIKSEGLKKMNRQHVHLSKDIDTAENVGGRRGKPVILTVNTGQMEDAGYTFYLSENKVWLTDHVPLEFINFQ
ncbi:MAG: RNA 2'-phosphotransferase [Crocinitomicaceae bacterium]|nr:RNA 2'-phosphotransferase [Crocinitomicaceae bacterium]